MLPFVAILIAGGLGALVYWLTKLAKEGEAKRIAELAGYAEGRGWRFRNLLNQGIGWSKQYPVLGQSGLVDAKLGEVSPLKDYWNSSLTSFVDGEIEGIPMEAFETFTVVSTGKTVIVVYLTVMSIRVHTPLGRFAMHPTGVGDKVAKWFGGQDIVCGEKEFDERFRLTGENPEAVRELFHEGTRLLCVRNPKLQMAVVGDRVLIWENVRLDQGFLERSAEFLHRLWDEIPEGWRKEEALEQRLGENKMEDVSGQEVKE